MKKKNAFQDPDPAHEERRRSVEKNILKHMGQLSEDNIYVLLSYAHDLLEEQLREESREERQARYDKDHTTQVCLKLNLRTDEDILKWLWKQKSKQGAIKDLIRREIARENCPGKE